MDTKTVIESLLYHSNNIDHLRNALTLSRVLSNSRRWHSIHHRHLDSMILRFPKPNIIVTIDTFITVFIINTSTKSRVLELIRIDGRDCIMAQWSKTKILQDAVSTFRVRDFMPESNFRQIIWIPYEEPIKNVISSMETEQNILNMVKKMNTTDNSIKIKAIVFTEHINGEWALDSDTSNPDPMFRSKTSAREILSNILKEVEA